jgi:hypothetical protein
MKFLSTLFPILASFSPVIDAGNQTDTRYLFFLHNQFIESHGPADQHPSYGRAEYQEILQRFRKDGFVVISEKRPANTDAKMYAIKVAGQVDSLLKTGIDPSHITIAGTSKGGYIAQYVSSLDPFDHRSIRYRKDGLVRTTPIQAVPTRQLPGNHPAYRSSSRISI